MAMSEQDLEQLEQYLDGELDSLAVSQVESQLQGNVELTSTLAELKAQRAVRSAVWQSMDPDTGASERLVWRIKGAMLDQQRTAYVETPRLFNTWRIASIGSAAAACMVLGFVFGRVNHIANRQPVAPGSVQTDIASNLTHGSPSEPGPQIVQNTAPKPMPGTALLAASSNKTKISVPITNEYGQVVAWQTFDNPEDAKNFTEDLHKTREIPASPSSIPGQTRLVDQQQF